MKKEIKFSLVFRDMWQSAGKYVPRVDQLVKVAPAIVEMGCFARVETNGGGFEQVNLLFGENPNKAVRAWTKPFHEAGIQTHMLDRALNGLRMSPVPADVRKLFYKVKKVQGTDITRTFCGLNDTRNIIPSIAYAKEAGMISQCSLCITHSPIHTVEYYTNMALELIKAGADEICIKDMAGLLVPAKATELVQALKDGSSLPIQMHTHYTSGVASMTYMKAVEAGADIIDTAMSPFSMGTSQPATEVMVETFKGTQYDTGLDQNLLAEIADYFQPMREEALKSGLMNTKVLGVNIKTLLYQVPGGMLSNLVSQLKEAGAEDKYQAVLEEIPKVRKDFGEPPLVTPSSQIVGTQAVLNVLQGERYKMITKESKKVLMGEFGQTIKPFNPEVQKKAIGDATPITCRPADLIEPQLEKFKNDPVVQQYKQQDEDVLSYALFPAVATEFFKYREAQQKKVDPAKADTENKAYPV